MTLAHTHSTSPRPLMRHTCFSDVSGPMSSHIYCHAWPDNETPRSRSDPVRCNPITWVLGTGCGPVLGQASPSLCSFNPITHSTSHACHPNKAV